MNWHDFMGRLFGRRGDPPDPPENPGVENEPGGITCAQAAARLYEYLDSELEPESSEAVREHLEVCEACFPRLAFEQSFREVLRRVRDGEKAPREVKQRILRILEEEGFRKSS